MTSVFIHTRTRTYTQTNRQIWKILYCRAPYIYFFQIYTIMKPHATWECTQLSCPFLDFSHFSSRYYKPCNIPSKLKHGWLSCNVTWQFDCSSDLFTVDMWLLPLLGQLEKTEYRSFHILHAEDPERVLLGSLRESDNHRLILLYVFGWSISEQGSSNIPRMLAMGFADEHPQTLPVTVK